MVPELALQAHFPRGKHDASHHGYISGIYYEFIIESFNGKQMMGPKDMYIYTTGMAGGPKVIVELLLAAKGSSLPEEKWSPDELTPPVSYTRDGFYAVLRRSISYV
jgi:hypothetical protein